MTKAYTGKSGGISEVLGGIDLDVLEGEFIAILGFSGAGKTTLISAIAGLVEPDAGEILLRGEAIDGPGKDRGLVFQSYSLFPWLTVEANVALAVDAVHKDQVGRGTARRWSARRSELVGLGHAMDRKPAQLSGGMRQRVAVARALAMEPEILLLDEPLSALDALTRAKLQDEIERIRKEEKRTIILVTNDVDEALLLADRVAVLTPAPAARIGQIFEVNLPRPRDREAVNDDAAFQALRREIVGYLGSLVAGQQARGSDYGNLPNVTPLDLAPPPKAYQRCGQGRHRAALHGILQAPQGLSHAQGSADRGRGFQPADGQGRVHFADRPLGLRQIDRADHGRRAQCDQQGLDRARQPRDRRCRAGQGGGVPGPQPDALADRAAECRAGGRAGLSARQQGRTARDRRLLSRARRPRTMRGTSWRRKCRTACASASASPAPLRSRPRLLLLDEPFGMLDSLTRWDLQDVLVEVWNRTKVTAIMVTHDVDEAILLADRVVMMTNGPNATIGKMLQVDLPRPRDRKALLKDPQFYAYRQEVLHFLAEYDHGPHAEAA